MRFRAHRRPADAPRGEPIVLIAGIALAAVGVLGAVNGVMRRARRLRARAGQAQDAEDAGHHHGWPAWLLLLPVAAVLLTPPALGSDAVARDSGSQAWLGDVSKSPAEGQDAAALGLTFAPLPPGDSPQMGLKDFVQRTIYAAETVADTPVTVSGFVAAPAYGEGYSIARMVISCCAADARAMQV